MSEHQYYEFRAVDRPLGREERDELRKVSSRAEITPTGLTNTYSYGDFEGEPRALMARHFDAFVYVANRGTRRLMSRVPRGLLDIEAASAYEFDGEGCLSIEERGDHVLIEFRSEHEGDEEEPEEWLPTLLAPPTENFGGEEWDEEWMPSLIRMARG